MESKLQLPPLTQPPVIHGIGPISNVTDRIELADDVLLQNDTFKRNVALPYFKDIYKDIQ